MFRGGTGRGLINLENRGLSNIPINILIVDYYQ